MSSEGDNFFSRWSRRKVQVRSGEPLPAEPLAPSPPVVPAATQAVVLPGAASPVGAVAVPANAPPESQPVLTLDDVARLTPESDFSTFVARGVPAHVRNAAVKKLFADPHFNVMDGLDIYIDDYSKPSPLSVADMAKMVGAQFLKLVDDPNEPRPTVVAPGAADADTPHQTAHPTTAETEAASPVEAESDQEPATEAGLREPTAPESPEPHDDHADLQLQPDDAPGPQGPGHGTG